jgi:hypothetical protein
MKICGLLHSFRAEDRGDLNHGFYIVFRIEEGESAGQNGEEYYPCRPDVDFGGLFRAFEENLRGAKSAGPSAIGSSRGARVIFGISR